ELLTLRGHIDSITDLAIHPDGMVLVSSGADQTLKFWHADQPHGVVTFGTDTGPLHVSFLADGKRLASGHADGTVRVWDVQSGRELLSRKRHTDDVVSIAPSPDGGRFVSASFDKTLKVCDAQSGKELLTLTGHTDRIRSAAFSADGKRIVSCTAEWDQ